jgi:hypothetical protein
LRPLVDSSDDPEYAGQLAELLASDNSENVKDEVKALRARAAARWDELLARHPEAFADHAARFYLGVGGAPARALPLAEKNLAARRTAESFALLVDAALAAGDVARACAAAESALAGDDLRSARLYVAAWRALSSCGRKDRADAALRSAQALEAPGR